MEYEVINHVSKACVSSSLRLQPAAVYRLLCLTLHDLPRKSEGLDINELQCMPSSSLVTNMSLRHQTTDIFRYIVIFSDPSSLIYPICMDGDTKRLVWTCFEGWQAAVGGMANNSSPV